MYLFFIESQIAERRERGRDLPCCDAFPKWLQRPDLRRSKARCQGILPGLLLGLQGPKDLGQLLLPSQGAGSEAEQLGLKAQSPVGASSITVVV